MKIERGILRPFFVMLIFGAMLWVLFHALSQYNYRDIIHDLTSIPASSVALALALTLLNYFVMTAYDALGLQYVRHPLEYGKIAVTSFIGYAFSQSLGLPLLTGGSIRYRLYTAWGLSTAEIAQVIAFTTVTFWLGVLAIGGATLLFQPVAHAIALPAGSRMLGLLFLAAASLYFLWSARGKTPVQFREWEFSPPPLRLSLSQMAVSCTDWLIAGTVLYVLLPSNHASYTAFLGIFLLSQIFGLVSSVPGGLGVFETSMILMLSPVYSMQVLLSVLMAYRAIYYLFPLCLSAILFGAVELLRKRTGLARALRILGKWVPEIAPTVFAFTTFLAGAILLFSGATPAVTGRLQGLRLLIPLELLEASHFLGSLAGVGLLLLARNLQRRVDAAYLLTSLLLATGIVASLLKGFDYEEAAILTVLLIALLPCRRFFYRKASLTGETFTREWISAIILVLISSVWLTFFSYKHVNFSNELWWQFTLSGDAPRSLRAAVGAFGFAFAFALVKLLRPAPASPGLPQPAELEMAKDIIARCPNTLPALALLGDKSLLFSATGKSFLMYSVEGRSWISLAGPVGAEEEKAELMWRFHELCHRNNGWTVFYEVDRYDLPLYLDLGLTLLKLGEEARVPLETFSLEGGSRKNFRNLMHKMQKDGYHFEILPPENIACLLPQMRRISDAWLAEKHTREKRFSLGYFNESYLKHFPAGVVGHDGKILAFINIWLGANKEELSLDLMRSLPEAPSGMMDYLFLHLMLWGKQNGYRWFNLGMAPLSGLEDRALAPFWNRLGALLFRHGEHFYNFQGLRQYKEKFDPVWEPKYLASPGGLALPAILTNVAALISGGLKGVITK